MLSSTELLGLRNIALPLACHLHWPFVEEIEARHLLRTHRYYWVLSLPLGRSLQRHVVKSLIAVVGREERQLRAAVPLIGIELIYELVDGDGQLLAVGLMVIEVLE